MNRFTHFFLLLLLASMPLCVTAQNNNDNNDNKYLTGAVPEIEGKVVFSKEFSVPGMSQEQIFERMHKWMGERLEKNKNIDSRVVYTEKEQGMVAGVGEEWLIFKSSALSLDRAQLNYQITVDCHPAKCLMKIEKIRYTYREKEKYTAEGWIIDKYALNKAQTKLVRGLAKWRRKTVDFTDQLFAEAAKALGVSESTVTTPAVPVNSGSIAGYTAITPDQLSANAIQMGTGKLVIAIGEDAFNMTMMTANAGGSLGKIAGKPVVFSILSPDQAYESIEKAHSYTVRFYPTNQSEASVILECKKLPAAAPMEGQPRTYVGEIVKAWIK